MSDGMKMVMIAYNEAMDMEIMESLERCGIKGYTRIKTAYGKGEASGTHMGNDVWPGRNNIIYAACDAPLAEKLISEVRALREQLGHEGVKSFVWDLSGIT